MAGPHSDTRKHVTAYLRVFAALLALTVVTVAVSEFRLAVPIAVAVALSIAVLKGSLVASFFMHLITERPLIFAALTLTGVLLAALLALPVLTSWVDQIGTLQTPWTLEEPSTSAKEH